MNKKQRKIELTEYRPLMVDKDCITIEEGKVLWQNYGAQINVEFPTPRTDNRWQLTSQGWVGCIPLEENFSVLLQPKVNLANLFGMLEYAYNLKSIKFLEGFTECKSLEDFYERLASMLSKRILDRGRKGYYSAYLSRNDELPYLRGRLDIAHLINKPWEVRLRCHYEEHTSDIDENQILCWTLFRIARTGMCTERVLPTVRRAYRSLLGLTSLTPHGSEECIGRMYNRLNDDYHPMHILCRFFLEHSGPSHEVGEKTMLPFLVNMERLYELFIAKWLEAYLPRSLDLRWQDSVELDEAGQTHFDIDIVLQDAITGQIQYVIDAKYKTPDQPSSDDIAKVVAYAEAKDCTDAILIYPTKLTRPFKSPIGRINVRTLTFSLDGDLNEAGKKFLNALLRRE